MREGGRERGREGVRGSDEHDTRYLNYPLYTKKTYSVLRRWKTQYRR